MNPLNWTNLSKKGWLSYLKTEYQRHKAIGRICENYVHHSVDQSPLPTNSEKNENS